MSNDIFINGVGAPAGAGGEGPGALRDLLTLAVDTASGVRSVAVLRGEMTLAVRARAQREAGASTVLLDLDEVLREASADLEAVGLFAAAVGPGSFTGLRAGLATVRGLAVALGRRAVGVPTLHALAHAAGPSENVMALIPAGRGEFYAQSLGVGAGGEVTEYGPPAHVGPEVLLKKAAARGGGLKWACAGADAFAGQLREAASAAGLSFRRVEEGGAAAARGEWVLSEVREPLAPYVALLARGICRAGGAAGADSLKALYVRPSDAELKE